MKTVRYNFPIKLLVIMACFPIFSCKKIIAIDPPINESIRGKVFSSESSANSAISGLYSNLLTHFDNERSLFPSFSADELKNNTTNFISFYTNSLKSEDGDNLNQWANLYNLIYQSNAIIEGIQRSNTLSLVFKNQLKGEAKFIRAFMHFELVNFYGDIPLITSTDVKENSIGSRKPQEFVYQQIIADLKDSQDLLTNNYVSVDRARINKSVATALLARVYLYTKNYAEAENQATNLIENSDTYQLSTLQNAFIKTSKETIFQLSNANGYTTIGNAIVPSLAALKANYSYTNDFKESIEVNDDRKNIWMKTSVFNGNMYLYPYKYKKTSSTTNEQVEYLIVFRLAEQYLIRAEARAQQNKLSEARDDLNVIRNRAGLYINKDILQEDLLIAVQKERRIELSAEFGHRWFDLKRTNRVNDVMHIVKANWKSTFSLYPIPSDELANDPNLTQNLGY